jgi:hypothetical protein
LKEALHVKFRKFSLAVATAAMALAAFAGTASAAATPATVFVAHGIPGVAVDVCVNGSIVAKANFKYGQQFKATLPAGTYTFRVRAHTAIPCHGKVLIYKRLALTSGLNATAVANVQGGTPHLSIFVNDLTGTDGTHATITVHHTATAPKVDVWLNGGTAPAVPGLATGASAGPVPVTTGVYSWWVSLPGKYAPVIAPRVRNLAAGYAYQIYAVGTSTLNYRFIVIGQAGA